MPGQIEYILSQGWDGFVSEQLNPRIDEVPASLSALLHRLTCFGSPTELYASYWWQAQVPNPKAIDLSLRKRLNVRENGVYRDARNARLARAIDSPWQLHESLVEFWFNHFNVFWGKGEAKIWVGAYEQQAIRPNVLGRFSDLLLATAKHPAMLVYLDNAQNLYLQTGRVAQTRGVVATRPSKVGINENYAREVIELHTLGVDGGYTQNDVTALAHILTGWTVGVRVDAPVLAAAHHFRRLRGASSFVRRWHDPAPQSLLGRRFNGETEDEADAALLFLAQHPSTAHHISYKLAQFFVADEPPHELVTKMSQTFQQENGNIRAVLAAMFSDPGFRSPTNFGKKFKSPYRYVVSVARSTKSSSPQLDKLNAALVQLGQPLYGCISPDGYASVESSWLNPDAMLERISIARRAAAGAYTAIETTDKPFIDPDHLLDLVGDSLSIQTLTLIRALPAAHRAAAILGSPDFMHC